MSDQHIASAFDRDLEAVQAQILKMGGLVEDAIRNIASASMARWLSTSIKPWVSKWMTLPRRATAVTAPWIRPESM